MRCLLAVILFWIVASPCSAAIALVSQGSSSGSNTEDATTDSFNSTGATLMVVAFNYSPDAPSPTITDSKSNSYTLLTPITTLTGANRIRLAYCVSPTVGTGHTVTVEQPAFTAGYPVISAYAFSGAGVFDQAAAGDEEGGTSMQPGSITPSENNCLLFVAGTHDDVTSANAVNSSFSTLTKVAKSGSNRELLSAYKIQTTAGAENPTLSWTTFNWSATVMASFKAITATPPTITTLAAQSLEESERDVATMAATGDATITWSITGGDDAAFFEIDEDTGELTMPGSADYENPEDDGANNVYEVEVTATNGEGDDDLAMSITITDEGGAGGFAVDPLGGGPIP